MTPTKKLATQAALLIHGQLAGGKRQNPPIYLAEYTWNKILRIQRQIGLAYQHNWHGAAAQLTRDLADSLEDWRRELANTLQALQVRPPERQACSASDIYRDILALESEFEEVDIDLEEHALSVTTDRIVLAGLHLGAFQIRLDWRKLGRPQPYRVVALDPNPPARRGDITHPHVQDEQLCEGEGRSAIRAALAEGRLLDFFLLVSQVLHTYGRGSAYVELDNWDGVPCADCGNTVSQDDCYNCQRCGATLCDGCSVSCHACGDSYCSECVSRCAACGYDHCSSCLATCPVCRKRVCEECREEGLCRACHEKQHHEEHEDDSSEYARNEPIATGA
jgi:hypothetical protein